jgi:hypothetical protein
MLHQLQDLKPVVMAVITSRSNFVAAPAGYCLP